MKEPLSIYLLGLNQLQDDLFILMDDWPNDSSFNEAKIHAEKIAPLVAGQIEKIIATTSKCNEDNPISLRDELERLCDLMTVSDASRFSQHVAMIDSLIDNEAY
jgi:hypothetical protein